MIPPRKPFPDYKWRWATLTPTEGLNEPPVYLGVLRVLRENEGGHPNSAGVAAGLARVQREVETRVATRARLDRTGERNLIRNSGQYWKALGLLAETQGIQLTVFGEAVADGRVTRDEFAATVVKNLELPNRAIQDPDDVAQWDRVRLRIRPLQLILNILHTLLDQQGRESAFITPAELVRIVIPLAGTNAPMAEYISSLIAYRQGRLNLAAWPDCAPAANDKRMAREFLLFLAYYNFCRRSEAAQNEDDRFVLESIAAPEIESLIEIPVAAGQDSMATVAEIRAAHVAAFTERQRILRPVLSRPQQGKFRKAVLDAYNYSCLLTGERIPEALEASHIIPVEYQGADATGNGFCFRADIHNLFDAGHIRIAPNGTLSFSDAVQASPNYRALPRRVAIPRFVLAESIEWRWNYQ